MRGRLSLVLAATVAMTGCGGSDTSDSTSTQATQEETILNDLDARPDHPPKDAPWDAEDMPPAPPPDG